MNSWLPPAGLRLRLGMVLGLLAVGCGTALAQRQRIEVKEWNHVYSDVELAVGSTTRGLPGMIDTGCTLCVVDSAYAVDSCGMDLGALQPMKINRHYTAYRAVLDSVGLCATVHRQVECCVVDLKGLFRQYAPRFIVGANILRTGAWLIDLERGFMEPWTEENETAGTVLRWECPSRFQYGDGIFLRGKVEGRKTWFIFDTGARDNSLQPGLYTGPVETVKRETARIGHPLELKDTELCRGVRVSVGKSDYVADFTVYEDRAYGLLSLRFLQGRPFVLDYRKKRLVIR